MKASQKQNWCDFHVFYFPGGTGFFSPSAINSTAEGVSYMDEADWYRHSHKTVRLYNQWQTKGSSYFQGAWEHHASCLYGHGVH